MPPRELRQSVPRDVQKRRSRDRLINLLLQGIIAANPHHDDTVTDEVRLARAREALLGEKLDKGRKTIRDDLKLFPLIEQALKAETDKMKRAFIGVQPPATQAEWQRELAEKPKSLRAIAKQHLPMFVKPSVQPESTIDRLRRTLKTLDLTTADMADLEGLFHGDSPKADRLRRIFDDLRMLGIDAVNPRGTESDALPPKRG